MPGDVVRRRLIQLPRSVKRVVVVSADVLLVALAVAGALLLVHPADIDHLGSRWALLPLSVAVALPAFASQGLYQAVIRFIGTKLVLGALRGVVFVTLLVTIAWLSMDWDPPKTVLSVTTVACAFLMLTVVGSRFLARLFLLRARTPGERVAVYGAGEAGARLVAALIGGREFTPVVFLDDNRALQGNAINGVPVYPPERLGELVQGFGIKRVLLALPSLSRRERYGIIERLEKLPVRVQTVPDIGQLLSGQARVDQIRDVEVADLLGRDPVPPNERLLDACIRGKSVMVTGAGGSIGAELCRQILRLGPRRLVLYEISELALYTIEQELRLTMERERIQVELLALLGSVTHRERMRQAVGTFGVQTMYHAAAYKHVPIVEHNMIEGIYNNVLGTWHAAEAARYCGVETFVLVSTDKAVSPVNVMGATKRFAELVLQGLAERGGMTRFCMVRFGNVLDSSGSVVPLFREQIRRGGPVTVTHPEIIRYFMTIPEAAQLVLQAGAMSQGGDVFVLDMGKPVRIADLARRMIHLMGFSVRDQSDPDGDIAIEYTGLRPAEKLYEELLIGSNVMGTEHPMIMRAMEESLPWARVNHYVEELVGAARSFDCERVRALLMESVSGYVPGNGVDDLVWQRNGISERQRKMPAAVADLSTRRAATPAVN
jgi:FlaA1/EpsC-like NDP-sugar epimerase